jgi:oxygen-independent coproporphyrinogen-3 oxidase
MDKKPLSIYIHVPFCESRCPYCDFKSSAGADEKIPDYYEKVMRNVITKAAKCKNYAVETIYFGGGTPSYINADYICGILDCIRANFVVAGDVEISIECNPNSLTAEKAERYKAAGVNRISIGVQSFSNDTLETLGRKHTAEMATGAIKTAKKYFDNISVDIMYNVAGHAVEIDPAVLKLVTHVSAYALTSDRVQMAGENTSADEQIQIEKTLGECGFLKYEVSNFARAGFKCRHNLVYWRCGEWLGFGAGGKSHFGAKWSRADRIMLGMRLAEGVPMDIIGADKASIIAELVDLALLEIENGRLKCTDRGFLLLNQILLKII